MIIGGKEFDTENQTYIMGILNVTPDSFRTAESTTGLMLRLPMPDRWQKKGRT